MIVQLSSDMYPTIHTEGHLLLTFFARFLILKSRQSMQITVQAT